MIVGLKDHQLAADRHVESVTADKLLPIFMTDVTVILVINYLYTVQLFSTLSPSLRVKSPNLHSKVLTQEAA